MSNVVISIENLGKKYRIRHQTGQVARYKSLREILTNAPGKFAQQLADTTRTRSSGEASSTGKAEEFWALRDVSFDVREGEVIGIIGRNGAGKSTLLKILSRITEPSCGRVRIRGRIASLLEVGTGFHPELTGRENIYLNGAILGMSKAEIKRKFDEIVAFADIERFLDTPVKRYSSGMYVRLAFAVAAHLEPEIMVIDEVLAVGDVQFQQKCMGKMQEVSTTEGRTVLFVSHNMAAISSMTDRALLLENGKIAFDGDKTGAIERYLSLETARRGAYRAANLERDHPFVSSITLNSETGEPAHISGCDMLLTFEICHKGPIHQACFAFHVLNQFRQAVLHCWVYDSDFPICRTGDTTVLKCRIPRLALNIGSYSLDVYLAEPPGGRVFEKLEGVCPFSVEVLNRQTLFGWRPEAATYLADFEWSLEKGAEGSTRYWKFSVVQSSPLQDGAPARPV